MQRVPKQLPPLSMLIDDVGGSIKNIANYLEVEEQTIKRWLKKEHAPRAYMLALFFVSRWGWSHVNCNAENAARISACLLAAKREAYNKRIHELTNAVAKAYLHGQLSIVFNKHQLVLDQLQLDCKDNKLADNQQFLYLSLNS